MANPDHTNDGHAAAQRRYRFLPARDPAIDASEERQRKRWLAVASEPVIRSQG